MLHAIRPIACFFIEISQIAEVAELLSSRRSTLKARQGPGKRQSGASRGDWVVYRAMPFFEVRGGRAIFGVSLGRT
jgi:hypothetical protein